MVVPTLRPLSAKLAARQAKKIPGLAAACVPIRAAQAECAASDVEDEARPVPRLAMMIVPTP